MSHTTFDGVAVAVAVTGPAVADAVSVCQAPGSIHSHVATPTSCGLPDGGAISIVGDPKPSCLTACWADHHRVDLHRAAAGWASVTHTGGIGSMTPGTGTLRDHPLAGLRAARPDGRSAPTGRAV